MSEQAVAPDWVQSVLPSEIVRQRSLGWPDFHPEDFCHICGQRNPIWFTAADEWSDVFDGHAGIVCPGCFDRLHGWATGSDLSVWELRLTKKGGES